MVGGSTSSVPTPKLSHLTPNHLRERHPAASASDEDEAFDIFFDLLDELQSKRDRDPGSLTGYENALLDHFTTMLDHFKHPKGGDCGCERVIDEGTRHLRVLRGLDAPADEREALEASAAHLTPAQRARLDALAPSLHLVDSANREGPEA